MYQKLRELYESGKTIHEMADELEIGADSLYRRLKKSGVTMRPSGRPSGQVSTETERRKNKAIQLRAQNLSQNQIAKIMGCSRPAVRYYLSKTKKI